MSAPNLLTQEDWIQHTSRRMPVDGETEVLPAFGFGVAKHPYLARQLNWIGHNDETRIVSYKIVRAAAQ
jgi:hypothetical protein